MYMQSEKQYWRLWYHIPKIELSTDVSVPLLITKKPGKRVCDVVCICEKASSWVPCTPTPVASPPGSLYLYWHRNVLTISYFMEIFFLIDSLFLISILLCNTSFCWSHFWFSLPYNCCYFQHLYSPLTSVNEVQIGDTPQTLHTLLQIGKYISCLEDTHLIQSNPMWVNLLIRYVVEGN